MTFIEFIVLLACFVLAMLLLMLAALCVVSVVCKQFGIEWLPALASRRSDTSGKRSKPPPAGYTDADERNRRREAWELANFWSYDGSEQEEWQE